MKINTGKKVLLTFVSVIACTEAFFHLYPSFGGKVTKKDLEEYKKRNPYIKNNKFSYPDEWKLDGMEKNVKVSYNKSVPKQKLTAKAPDLSTPENGKYKVTWFGHSSVMIQDDGKNIMVDPVLVQRFFPVPGMGPKRFSELPLTIDELPHIHWGAFVISDHAWDDPIVRFKKEADKEKLEYLTPSIGETLELS